MRQFKTLVLACLLRWLPLAVLTVLLCGMVYGAVQQEERGFADDPQIQMAQDAANALNGGATPQSVVPATSIDIAQSLAPYLVAYDANGQMVAASATLHGQPLNLPPGVFGSARATDMDRITWQPADGVREAIVVVHYNDGFVMAGRSLKLVEQRESNLLLDVCAGGLFTLGATFVAVMVSQAVASRVTAMRVHAG